MKRTEAPLPAYAPLKYGTREGCLVQRSCYLMANGTYHEQVILSVPLVWPRDARRHRSGAA